VHLTSFKRPIRSWGKNIGLASHSTRETCFRQYEISNLVFYENSVKSKSERRKIDKSKSERRKIDKSKSERSRCDRSSSDTSSSDTGSSAQGQMGRGSSAQFLKFRTKKARKTIRVQARIRMMSYARGGAGEGVCGRVRL
jgi:hypothetical protein